jgi:hypothetical protein
MFSLLVFWKLLEPNMHFSLTVLLVPIDQTRRDSTMLNVVRLGLVVDSSQWRICVCMSACVCACICVCVFFFNTTPESQTFILRMFHID